MKSSVLLTAEAGKGEEEEHNDKWFALEEVSIDSKTMFSVNHVQWCF